MATLNLGILAHVDAGKTTITERLLHAAGVIDEIGRVDDGTTQTDSLALERQRGITIKSAVVSFVIDDVTVNLLDTPGHPDFIAEVERVLGVLDGAILVISAVEGVQSQTLVLFRALRRLGVPTMICVNKIDRAAADPGRALDAVSRRLSPAMLVMGTPHAVGTREAHVVTHRLADPAFAEIATEALAANDDEILRRYIDGEPLPPDGLRRALAEQTAELLVHPVYFAAALTGAGVSDLMHAIPRLLPAEAGDATGPASGTIFKIDRGPGGEKVAYVRLSSGTLRTRDRVQLRADPADAGRVTAIDVFALGATSRRPSTCAGEIAKITGLTAARIGDTFGPNAHAVEQRSFAPPTLETAVVPVHPVDKPRVFAALTELAEQDPLIDLRQDDSRQELFLSLYGEVQKEIVAQTLLADHGLEIEFRPTTPVCIERPVRPGSGVEWLARARSPHRPFLATVGLAITPLPPGSGVAFELDVDVGSIPIHVFDTVGAFRQVVERAVRDTFRQGLHGWEVTDCRVTMTDCDYQAPPRRWPGTTLSDYRLLTPLVLMAALKQAGTTVCEPVLDFVLEVPADVLGPAMSTLHDVEAQPRSPEIRGSTCILGGTIRVARLHDLQARLPDLARGEGVLEHAMAGYRPVGGEPPSRPRTDLNPLDRADYLRRVKGVVLS